MSLDPNKTYLEWKGTTFPNSSDAEFKAPAGSTIDWGDGTIENFATASTSVTTHTYSDGKTNHTIIISGLNYIETYSFYGCNNLTSVNIGNSVTIVGGGAFAYCSNLTSVVIPDSVTSISGGAFNNCTSLKSVTISNNLTNILGYTFQYCTSLTSITIPDSVISIGAAAFKNCSSLTSVIIGKNVTSIENNAFQYCSGLTSITIPDSVTSIGYAAFQYCNSLTSVIIGNGVTSIDVGVFHSCDNLKTIVLFPETPPTLGRDFVTSTISTIYVQQSSKEAYKMATNWKAFADKIESNNTYLSLIRFNKKNKEFIQEQIDNSYQARQGTNNSLNSIPIVNTFPTEIITIPCIPYSAFGDATDIETYCRNFLKWLCSNYPNKENITFIGQMHPNSIGFGIVHIYNTSELNNEGYPRHSSGMYVGLQTTLRLFGTMEYTFTYKEI